MNAKQLATMLDGRQMGHEITVAECEMARKAGLVVVFGYSDDNVELRGAAYGEVSAYNGTTVYLTSDGLLANRCEDDQCPSFLAERDTASRFRARWCATGGAAWTFDVQWPHHTFLVFEDDEVFCEGVVFALSDAAPRREGEGR